MENLESKHMLYTDFVKWVYKNTPEGIDHDDFIQYLASFTADLINMGAQRRKQPVKAYIIDILENKIDDFYTH